MHTVSIINYKGGVGKTTTTANIAAQLAYKGHSVLLLDMDPQASLTFSFVSPDDWDKNLSKTKTIKSWFDAINVGGTPVPLSSLIITPQRVAQALNGRGKLDLIASHLGLINVDLELATQLSGGTMAANKRNYLRVHRRLAEGIGQLVNSGYEYVLIDCPPNFNVTTKNALVASDCVLIPAKPDYLSTLGIDYLNRNLKELVRDFNDYGKSEDAATSVSINPRTLGVVFTMIQIRSGAPISTQRTFISQTKRLGIPTFDNMIRENKTIFGDAPQFGVPVVLQGYSQQTYSDIVTEVESLVTEFEKRIITP